VGLVKILDDAIRVYMKNRFSCTEIWISICLPPLLLCLLFFAFLWLMRSVSRFGWKACREKMTAGFEV